MQGTENKKELLESLLKLWLNYPELRLMQFLISLAPDCDTMYYLEDDELKKIIEENL